MSCQELDFLDFLEKQEQIRLEAEREKALIDDKYKELLDEYVPASKKMRQMVDEFNKSWEEVLKPYRKEVSALRKKYKELSRK